MKSILLACTISTFTVQAVTPPLALVPGPEHEAAYLSLFNHLEDAEWRAAHLRYGERKHGKRLIFVGIDRDLETAFKASSWRILAPPYQAGQATMVFIIPPLRGNERGMARILGSFGLWVMPGGFFVVQPFVFEEEVMAEYAENARVFLMRGFDVRLGGLKIRDRYYDVYQKRHKESA